MPHPGQTPGQSPRASNSHQVHNRARDSKEHLFLNNKEMMEKLHSQQGDAVEFGEGSLLVVAGAGAGKDEGNHQQGRVSYCHEKGKAGRDS